MASVQIGSTAWAGSGYRMEIYGEEGTLVAVSVDSPQLQQVSIRGARGGSNDLQELTPAADLHPAPEMPGGSAYNVGQLYSRFAASIRRSHQTPEFPTSTMPWDCIALLMPSDSPATKDGGLRWRETGRRG